jgi:RHS repeat-associated protein
VNLFITTVRNSMKSFKSRLRISLAIALILSVSFGASSAIAQTLLRKFACPDQTGISTWLVDEPRAEKSTWSCDQGTKVRISEEHDPLDIADVWVERLDDGPHRTKVHFAWKAGRTGTIKVRVQYKRRYQEWHGGCDWTGWRDLYDFEVIKQPLSSGGGLSGPTSVSVPTNDTEYPVTFTYTPTNSIYTNSSPGVRASKIRINTGRLDANGFEIVDETAIFSNNGVYQPTTLTYYATGQRMHYINPEVFVHPVSNSSCGSWVRLSQKSLSVRSSCSQTEFETVYFELNGLPGNAEDTPPSFQVNKGELYTLKVYNITNFDAHFTWDYSDFAGDVEVGTDIVSQGTSFKPLKDGSYQINVVPRVTDCPVPRAVPILVGMDNLRFQSNCTLTLPDDISKYYPSIDAEDAAWQHVAGFAEARTIIVKPGINLELGAELFLKELPQELSTDSEYNFIESLTRDEYGRTLTHTRTYFDDNGRKLQTQAKNFESQVVLADAVIYDQEGRAALTTLPAPVRGVNEENTCPGEDPHLVFQFREDFITSGGKPYHYSNFDKAKENNPDPIDQSVEGTLGWYYSNNNQEGTDLHESLIPVSEYPYSRTFFRKDGSGTALGTTIPGEAYRPGSGRLATSVTEKVDANDPILLAYLEMRRDEFGESIPENREGKFIRIVELDIDGRKIVTYLDKAEKELISVLYGSNGDRLTYACNFYDAAGRMRASVSPKGMEQYSFTREPEFQSNFDEIDKVQYFYDERGLPHFTDERVAGQNATGISRTEFICRKDGKIRFSQNEEQRKNSTQARSIFSYVNFDHLGRPVESGVFTSSDERYSFNSTALLSILENVTNDGGLSFNDGFKTEMTITKYDEGYLDPTADEDEQLPSDRTQRFLQGSVSFVKNDTHRTWYSYDELGRVEWIVQHLKGLGTKTLDYKYGPTGKVFEVVYQKNSPEERFTHLYEYNENAQVERVFTTTDQILFNRDGQIVNEGVENREDGKLEKFGPLKLEAKYSYFTNSALKRLELGTEQNTDANIPLQGLDYIYTIDGKLKAINDSNPSLDPGKDGYGESPIAKDVFGLVIDYYDKDYSTNSTESQIVYPQPYADQFGGLVKGIRWHSPIDPSKQFAYAFQYDVKGQLLDSYWGTIVDGRYESSRTNAFFEGVTEYDPNGNIKGLRRNENRLSSLTDYTFEFRYNYKDQHSNILSSLEALGGSDAPKIFRAYQYNDIGQLVSEDDGTITKFIKYTQAGSVSGVYSDAAFTKPLVLFTYDDRGFRQSKTVYSGDSKFLSSTFYVRDASGQMIAIYKNGLQDVSGGPEILPLELSEVSLIGSSRLGLYNARGGFKLHEISDHLGNVRAVLGPSIASEFLCTMETQRHDVELEDGFVNRVPYDGIAGANATPSTITVDDEAFTILKASKVNRVSNGGFGGNTPEPIGMGMMRLVHPGDHIGTSVEVLYTEFDAHDTDPITALSPFLTSVFNPDVTKDGASIFAPVDAAGFTAFPIAKSVDETKPKVFLNYLLFDKSFNLVAYDFDQVTGYGELIGKPPYDHERLQLDVDISIEGFIYVYVSNASTKGIEAYFDDLRIKHDYSNIVAGGDYYPYGLAMKDRQVDRDEYRYGYQGQFSEKDIETGWNHFQLREYDPIIGRWTTTDPERQFASPYVGMSNNPVSATDPDGGYSRVGAWWRNIAFGGSGIQQDEFGEWGYLTLSGSVDFGVTASAWKRTQTPVLPKRSQFWDFLLGKRVEEVNGQLQDISHDGYALGPYTSTGTVDLGGGIPAKGLKWLNNARHIEQKAEQIGNLWKLTAKVTGNKGSYTIYTKIIDSAGKTRKWYHDTYDATGKFLHRGWTDMVTKIKYHKWWDGFLKVGDKAGPHVPK